jgi:predicted alpha/beta hydrolase
VNAPETAVITARDGRVLPATWWEPPAPRAVTIVSPATGTPRGFYRAFCEYLASCGSAVVTYDYRGTFEPVAELRASSARMRDWGELDFAGAIETARRRFPHLPLYTVGHSVGGHVLLMTDLNREVARGVTVASQSGYWRLYRPPENYRVYAFVKVIMPVLTAMCGYFPGTRVSFGTNLAPGVLYEWSRWCTSPRYFGDDPSMRDVLAHAATLTAPTLMIGLTDDPWATRRAIDALQVFFTHAPVQRLEIDAHAEGLPPVGHIDFFRSRNRMLWERVGAFLDLNIREESLQ